MALTDRQIRDFLEPPIEGLPLQIAAPISIAISLKRIADFMCGSGAASHEDICERFAKAISTALDN